MYGAAIVSRLFSCIIKGYGASRNEVEETNKDSKAL